MNVQSLLAVLAPDGTAVVFSFMGSFEGIVDGGNDQDEPRDRGEDLVGQDGILGVGRGLSERVRDCHALAMEHQGKMVERTHLLASLLVLVN